MSKFLSIGGFRWIGPKEFDSKISIKNLKGCVLEVDLEYSKELRNWPYILNHLHRILIIGGSGSSKTRSRKNGDKDGKVLYKLMSGAVYYKNMENFRNRTDVKLMSNKKDYLKWTSKPSCMSQKIFDNDLVAIRKRKVTLTLSKSGYAGMCILVLGKALMYKFHYGYIKNKYGNSSRL